MGVQVGWPLVVFRRVRRRCWCYGSSRLDKEARAAECEVVRQDREDAYRQREKEAADAAWHAAEEDRKWSAEPPSERSIIEHVSRYSSAPDTLRYCMDTGGNESEFSSKVERI